MTAIYPTDHVMRMASTGASPATVCCWWETETGQGEHSRRRTGRRGHLVGPGKKEGLLVSKGGGLGLCVIALGRAVGRKFCSVLLPTRETQPSTTSGTRPAQGGWPPLRGYSGGRCAEDDAPAPPLAPGRRRKLLQRSKEVLPAQADDPGAEAPSHEGRF